MNRKELRNIVQDAIYAFFTEQYAIDLKDETTAIGCMHQLAQRCSVVYDTLSAQNVCHRVKCSMQSVFPTE